MGALWSVAFGFLPVSLQVIILGLVAVVVLILIFRIIAMILDSIPFL